ncbi:MAG: type IV pilin [Halobacteriales archaeon]|nr:type IV pilin [Halobacteriales archaeon]
MTRALAPVLGTVMLVVVTVSLAAVVGAVALVDTTPPEPGSSVVLSGSANASVDRITVNHESGPPLDVRRIRLRITVDGTPLTHQPNVPFFRITGFRAGPTGPFNSAADPHWTVGEETSLQLDDDNSPLIVPGSTVTVRVYRDETLLARLSVTAH